MQLITKKYKKNCNIGLDKKNQEMCSAFVEKHILAKLELQVICSHSMLYTCTTEHDGQKIQESRNCWM